MTNKILEEVKQTLFAAIIEDAYEKPQLSSFLFIVYSLEEFLQSDILDLLKYLVI
jgi:hypothetical protein